MRRSESPHHLCCADDSRRRLSANLSVSQRFFLHIRPQQCPKAGRDLCTKDIDPNSYSLFLSLLFCSSPGKEVIRRMPGFCARRTDPRDQPRCLGLGRTWMEGISRRLFRDGRQLFARYPPERRFHGEFKLEPLRLEEQNKHRGH